MVPPAGYGEVWHPPYLSSAAVVARPLAAPRAAPVAARQRRRLIAEVLLVLAVFPFPYVVSALVHLSNALVGNGAGVRTSVVIAGHARLSFPFEFLIVVMPLAAAGLAWFLLSAPGSSERPSDGGLRAIGLDRGNVRGDLALLVVLFVFAFVLPIFGGNVILRLLHIAVVSPGTGNAPTYYTLISVAGGITAGIVEEIVVLGYLVRRLEQLGYSSSKVLFLAVAVRGSYHLYYGWGVLPILVWATVSVLAYRRYRRLLPFIVVHALWDSSLFVIASIHSRNVHAAGVFLLAETAILLPLTFIWWVTWRQQIPVANPAQESIGTTL
jgi:membrane protease YdiL (CAAX protease family)